MLRFFFFHKKKNSTALPLEKDQLLLDYKQTTYLDAIFQNHRIECSNMQNISGWKGPLGINSFPLFKTRLTWQGCSVPFPLKLLIRPMMEISQPHWALVTMLDHFQCEEILLMSNQNFILLELMSITASLAVVHI